MQTLHAELSSHKPVVRVEGKWLWGRTRFSVKEKNVSNDESITYEVNKGDFLGIPEVIATTRGEVNEYGELRTF